jgi:predicted KAP-like P-loop ATPase
MVSESLAAQFGTKEAGRSFLEKIIQVPLPVPPADLKILKGMVFNGVESALNSIEIGLTQEEIELYVAVFDRSFKRKLSSPRAVKRYTNMLTFALPILKGEVNMLDLIIIEGVRAFYPKAYEMVRAEFSAFLKDSLENLLTLDDEVTKARFGKLVVESEWIKELTERERDSLYFALQVLFPNIREYGIDVASSYITSNSDDWEKKEANLR